MEINQLHDFKNHPFKVEVNTELCELMKSIEKEGVLPLCKDKPMEMGMR